MADQDIDIRLRTTADTRGAKQATRSIQDLERELQDATKAFRSAAAGSKEFTEAAARIRTINAEIKNTSRAAGSLGSRGNAGMAVLEFSRAFEDAQYGIRGVLNNIPLLVASLGGGAGLAGIISIAAVAGSQLWSRMNGGAKSAKEAVDEYKEAFDKAMEAFKEKREDELDDQKRGAKESAQALKEGLELNDDQTSASLFQARMEYAIEQSEQMLELARLRVKEENLAYLAANSSGKESLEYAKKREEVINSIFQKEMEMAEAKRQAQIREQRIQLIEAQNNLFTNQTALEAAQDAQAGVAGQLSAAQARLEAKRQERLGLQASKQARYDSINAELSAMSPQAMAYGQGQRLAAEGMGLKKEIDSLSRPWEAEGRLAGELETFEERIKEAAQEVEKAAEAYRLAQREFDQGKTALEQMQERQGQERVAEASMGMADIDAQASSAFQGAIGSLGGISGASPRDAMQIQEGLSRLKGAIGDDVADGAQAGKVAGQLQMMANSLETKDQATIQTIEEAIRALNGMARKYDDLKTRINEVASQVNQGS